MIEQQRANKKKRGKTRGGCGGGGKKGNYRVCDVVVFSCGCCLCVGRSFPPPMSKQPSHIEKK
jgi:hypothetical protein